MISDNSLSKRLNAVKKGDTPPPITSSEIKIVPTIIKLDEDIKSEMDPITTPLKVEEKIKSEDKIHPLLFNVYELSSIIILSFIYGKGFETIFSTHWSIMGGFSVGVIFWSFLNYFSKLFKKS